MISASGIWLRVSTEDQARGESPRHHERRARAYAEAKGWKVVELYDLSGVSGKTVAEHPETKRMLADVASGHISALIFSKLARLARNTRELLDFADHFREHEAGLISLQESIDTTTPAGRLFYTMIAAMAQWEREEISERVAASVPIRAQLGKPTGGAASYGYKWEGRELVPEPSEAPIRKLIYELFLEHRRIRTVAKELNRRGYRTRKGAEWSGNTIERLLTDTLSKGLRRANYTTSNDSSKRWELKPESEWVYSHVEPIVSEELWEEVNAIIQTQKASRKKVARKPAHHIFSGLAICECGEPMYVPSNSPKYTCRKCRAKIPTGDLDTIYKEQLKDFLISEDDIATYLNQADSVISEKHELLAVLQKEQRELQAEMDKIYKLYMNDEISAQGFGRKYKPLEARFEQLNEEVPDLQSEIDFLKIENLSSEQMAVEARDLYTRWPSLSQDEQQKIVQLITDKIVVDKDSVSIHFHYLPFFLSSGNIAMNQHGFIAATS
ncbi:MAG: recombinase family protein [Pseudomonadota bacterium]